MITTRSGNNPGLSPLKEQDVALGGSQILRVGSPVGGWTRSNEVERSFLGKRRIVTAAVAKATEKPTASWMPGEASKTFVTMSAPNGTRNVIAEDA